MYAHACVQQIDNTRLLSRNSYERFPDESVLSEAPVPPGVNRCVDEGTQSEEY